ncbi:MAG TPA: cellulase family glycosylhydrolase [Phycisphaerae bacterium]|nr:cellulase family glycosylhydrolase [Phycisphaerae bacterium]
MRRHVLLLISLGCLVSLGCHAARPEPAERFTIEDGRFVLRRGQESRPFTPWGFNYDRTVVDGRDMLLEDVMRERPAIVNEDFAAMRRLGGNTVRIFISTSEVLASPDRVNDEGLQRLDRVLDMAGANGLKVILVGLATIRPASIPEWMQNASDEQMEAAELLFWRTVARACRRRSEIFTYDLQNEPVVHWSNSDNWIVGCFDMPDGQRFCYVHQHYRQIESKWTRHVQAKYGTVEALRQHWPDFPRTGETWDRIAVPAFDGKDPRFAEYAAWNRGVFAAWAQRLADAIRVEDDTHLITVGALDPAPLAEAVDFYCYHLYPPAAGPGEDYLAKCRQDWEQRLSKVPADKPLVIEEFYPMWKPAGVPTADVLETMLDVTRDRCAGWISFYWGAADRLTWVATENRRLYEEWQEAWSAHAPK